MKWVAGVLAVLLVLGGVAIGYAFLPEWYYGGYPTYREVQEFMARYPAIPTRSEKVSEVRLLLWRLRFVESKEDVDTAQGAYESLSDYYLATRDDAVLEAVDATDADGAVSCYLCLFYERISKEEEYLRWLRDHPASRAAVLKCGSAWLLPEEVQSWIESAERMK